MNLYGIGVDMVNIDRIQRMHDKYGNGLAEKLLHPEEMKLFDQEKNPVHFIANRFAGKEAATGKILALLECILVNLNWFYQKKCNYFLIMKGLINHMLVLVMSLHSLLLLLFWKESK